MRIEERVRNLEEEFFMLSEELEMLQQHSTRRVNGLKQRVAEKVEEINNLLKEIQKTEGKNL